MKKPGAPLNVVDLAKTVRSKLVLLRMYPKDFRTDGTVSGVTNNSGRIYFDPDPQIDGSIVTGIIMHAGIESWTGPPYPTYDFAEITGSNADNYYTAYAGGPITGSTGAASPLFISLCDHQENYFWNQQAAASLTWYNTGQGKFIKRLYSRVKLEKCYIEKPGSWSLWGDNNNIIFAIPFTFFYMPAKI